MDDSTSRQSLFRELDSRLGQALFDDQHGCFVNRGLVVGMVGLPGRGKTCVSKKCARYLNWVGIKCKLYDVYNESMDRKMSVVDPETVAETLSEACDWLNNEGKVVIINCNFNTTKERKKMCDYVRKKEFNLLYVEYIINKESLVRYIIEKYEHVQNKDEVLNKIKNYSLPYETINEKYEFHSHVKVYNSGERITTHNCCNYMQTKIIQFLYHLNIQSERVIYLTRNAESENNVNGIIGGNSSLSAKGISYANALAEYLTKNCSADIKLWTSNMDSALETSNILGFPCENYLSLDNPLTGVCNGLTKQEVEKKFPEEVKKHMQDKFHHWFPYGESYHDVKTRLTPIILQLETEHNVIIVSHKSVIQCILGYFLNKSEEEIINIEVPRHFLIIVSSNGYTYEIKHVKILND